VDDGNVTNETNGIWYKRVKEVLRKYQRDVTVLVYTIQALRNICSWYVLRLTSEGIVVYDKGELKELFRKILKAADEAGLEQQRRGNSWVWTTKRKIKIGEIIRVEVMENLEEAKKWLKDAEDCLLSAKENLPLANYRVVVQNAQLCVEQSAKAIIACFEEPRWTHDPSDQLNGIITKHKDQIIEIFGRERVSEKFINSWLTQNQKGGAVNYG